MWLTSNAVNADAALKVTTTTSYGVTQTAPTSVVYYDVLGREVLSEVVALEAAVADWRRQRTEYDTRGRVKYVSIPYFSTQGTPTCTGAETDCTWYAYDVRDRVTREDRPDGGFTTTDYADAAVRSSGDSDDTVKQGIS
jgi:YD repeat-containing protein